MSQWPHDDDASLKAFYGDPGTSQHDLVVWESANLVYVPIPWKCFLAYDLTKPIAAIRFHKKLQSYLAAALNDVWMNVAKQNQDEIERLGMYKLGGAYNARLIRNGIRRSTHGYACAIDWNSAENKMHTKGNIDPRVRACFERQGAIWLSHDPMHTQWAASSRAMPSAFPEVPKPPSVQPVHVGMAQWIEISTPLIKDFEDFRANPYWDNGQWSNGFGQKCAKDAAPITEEQASANLAAYLADLAKKIAPLIQVKITPNQGAALLSFQYNTGALGKSTLLKLLNSTDVLGAAREFPKWNKSGGQVREGLKKRRDIERKLFLTP